MIPAVAVASHRFTDVPDANTFQDDIAWLADAEVTLGCNPPDNDLFCPDDEVTREQMAAFLRRPAENQVVDAATIEGYGADVLASWAAFSAQDDLPDTGGTVLEASIEAPAPGTRVITAAGNLSSTATADQVNASCWSMAKPWAGR